MKLIHLSDLHLGKRLNDFSMLNDQQYILSKIINIIDAEKPDAVLIAGDIYDKSMPSAEAVQLFDDFLVRLSHRGLKVFVISGNHDSPERIAFGARLMNQSGIHMSPVYNGKVEPVELSDEYGIVNIYMLPFIRPAHVKRYYLEELNKEPEKLESYTDAIRFVISNINLNKKVRNVMITHQFVTGASRCDSEDVAVGGSENVDAAVFDEFDYVALGHIHNPQNVGSKRIRYCGTPLKYSFSEANQEKSVTVIELFEKGTAAVHIVSLVPERDMQEIKGNYAELTLKSFYESSTYQNDYIHITLTDEDDIPDAIAKLRTIYPNIMKLDYDNKRTRTNSKINGADDVPLKAPLELFSELYNKQNNQPMTSEQELFVSDLIQKIWEASF